MLISFIYIKKQQKLHFFCGNAFCIYAFWATSILLHFVIFITFKTFQEIFITGDSLGSQLRNGLNFKSNFN